MSYERLAYDDQDSAHEMHDDCAACGSQISLPRQKVDNQAVTMPAPSLAYDVVPAGGAASPRSRSAMRRRTSPRGCTST